MEAEGSAIPQPEGEGLERPEKTSLGSCWVKHPMVQSRQRGRNREKQGFQSAGLVCGTATVKMRQRKMDRVWTWNSVSSGSICLFFLLVV